MVKQARSSSWPLSEYVNKSILIGSLLVIFGCIIVWLASNIESIWLTTVLSNVGTAIVITGSISIAYEAFLKVGLLNDVRRQQGLSQDIIDAGIHQVVFDSADIDYESILASCSTIHVFPQAPLTWAAANVPWIIRLASRRKLSCKIYLPSAKPYSTFLASFADDRSPEEAFTQCAMSLRDLAGTLKRGYSSLSNGSSVQIINYAGYPHSGFILAEDVLISFAPAGQGPTRDSHVIAAVFSGGKLGEAQRWAQQTLDNLNDSRVVEEFPGKPASSDASQLLPLQEELATKSSETVVSISMLGEEV